jgi:hypothetical protein
MVSEAVIRDKLAQHLEILEDGLTLLSIEKYLPNHRGTRGFIDILAKDKRNRLVLIELKRSDAAAREAMHEVLKYVEGIKTNLALRDEEIRVFVVSTTWNELIVPFSAFVQRVPLNVSGFVLEVDDVGNACSAEQVTALQLTEERLFLPVHEVALYESRQSLDLGCRSYESICKMKGVENYVLVILKAAAEHHETSVATTTAALNAMRETFGGEPIALEDIREKLTPHPYMIYFAMLKLDEKYCEKRIRELLSDTDPDYLEEIIEGVSDCAPEDVGLAWAEKLVEVDPTPERDYLEIGYPAKFTKILDMERWEIQHIIRKGTLATNPLLTDDTIISELRGEQGVTKQRFVRQIVGNDPSDIQAARIAMTACLEDNPLWRSQVGIAFEELREFSANSVTDISLLNPCHILLSLYLLLSQEDGVLYFPAYSFVTHDGATTQMVFGNLESNGQKPSMSDIFSKYYDNELFNFLMPLNWGGYDKHDAKIVRDIGLAYTTYKVIVKEQTRTFYKLTELGWEKCRSFSYLEHVFEFAGSNPEFLDDFCELYARHWNGFMADYHREDPLVFQT